MTELYQRAEVQLRRQRKGERTKPGAPKPAAVPQRLLHELEVHQVELELQNAELQAARDRAESLLEKYSDLYDFAPVGYLTLDRAGTIVEANLVGASLLGVARAALVKRRLGAFVSPADRAAFAAFLQRVLKSKTREECDVRLVLKGADLMDVRIRAIVSSSGQACRVAMSDITAYKQAEEKVRESEERFRVMANAMSQMAWIARSDGHVFWYNQRWHDYTGTTPEQMEGWGWQSVHDPVVLPKMLKLWKQSLATGADFEMTFPLRGADGSFRPFLTRGIALKDSAGRVVQWLGTNTDVFEQKLAEDKVRVSEVRYRRLFEAAHDGVLLLDPATRKITDANPFMTSLLGYSHAKFVGKELFEIGLLKDEAASKEMFQKLKQDREVRYEDLPLKSKAGRHQEVEVVANLYQENGHAVIQCNIRDITARKLAEDVLRRSEALFSTLVEEAPFGVYVVDARFRMQQVNRKARPAFQKVHPLRGRGFSEVVHLLWPKKVADQVEKRFRHTLKTGEPYQSPEFTARREDIGSEEIYEWQIQRVTLPAGEQGVVCFFNNITERKRAEETQRRVEVLAASNRKLEQEIVRRQAVEKSLKDSEQNKSRLLEQSRVLQEQLRQLSRQILTAQEEERREISRELHDVIAQTLAGINVRLAGLKQDAARNPKSLDRSIAHTQRLVEKSVDLVHQFARELRPAALDDLGLIPALHACLKSFTTRTGVRTRLTAFAAVEKLESSRRTVLYRVAQEALTNVARHAKASQVDVSLQQLPGGICMKIKDDGKSFDVERVLRTTGKGRLGLLGMRERLQMVGGCFEVESAPGQGTTIVAHLPSGKVTRGGKRSRLKPRLKLS
jgi:PAS domain S-box-containing protein